MPYGHSKQVRHSHYTLLIHSDSSEPIPFSADPDVLTLLKKKIKNTRKKDRILEDIFNNAEEKHIKYKTKKRMESLARLSEIINYKDKFCLEPPYGFETEYSPEYDPKKYSSWNEIKRFFKPPESSTGLRCSTSSR